MPICSLAKDLGRLEITNKLPESLPCVGAKTVSILRTEPLEEEKMEGVARSNITKSPVPHQEFGFYFVP